MEIVWSDQINVGLTQAVPEGSQDAPRSESFTVFGSYGNAPERLVQALAILIYGQILYFEVCTPDGRVLAAVPVPVNTKSLGPEGVGSLERFFTNVFRRDLVLRVFGSDRVRWELSVTTSAPQINPVDNGSDRSTLAPAGRRSIPDESGIRETF